MKPKCKHCGREPLSEEEVEKMVRDNIKWSPYGCDHYDMIDSYKEVAKAIVARFGQRKKGE